MYFFMVTLVATSGFCHRSDGLQANTFEYPIDGLVYSSKIIRSRGAVIDSYNLVVHEVLEILMVGITDSIHIGGIYSEQRPRWTLV